MKKVEIDKKLFLKYALPSLEERAKRKEITKKELKKLLKDFLSGKDISYKELERRFPILIAHLKKTAMRMGKRRRKIVIDKKVIRKYFLEEHSPILMGNVMIKDMERCFVLPALVKKVNRKKASVETPFGKREVLLDFIEEKNLKGKYVSVHYSYACEILSEERAKRSWEKYE